MSLSNQERMCGHCGLEVAIRNPSGFCDHLYYPDNCEVCKAANPTELDKLQAESQRYRTALEEIMEVTPGY